VEEVAVEYTASIRVAGTEVVLRARESIAIAANVLPEYIEAGVRCVACGLHSRGAAPVEFVYCDDDHFAQSVIGFRARLEHACPRCGARTCRELSITVTRYGDGSAELAWDTGPTG
jgi:hypothetical protein